MCVSVNIMQTRVEFFFLIFTCKKVEIICTANAKLSVKFRNGRGKAFNESLFPLRACWIYCKNPWLLSVVCSCWWSYDLLLSWPQVLKKKKASSRATRQMDTEREKSRMILWWSRFTDLNCSVHGVAHSYLSPCQSELKLEEFKVTFMFSYDAFGSASWDFY